MRIPAIAAAAVLVFGLAACGNSNGNTGATPTPAPQTTAAATSEAPATTQGGQETPETAAEVMLHSFGAGDARGACSIMASGTTTLEGNEDGLKACEDALKPLLDQLGQAAPQLKEAKVTGATINGDNASFENATATPEMAASVIQSMKAVKIKDKWYMTQ